MNNIVIYIGLTIAFQFILLSSYKFVHLPEKARLNRRLLLSILVISLVFPLILMQFQWNMIDSVSFKSASVPTTEIQLEEVQLFINAEVNTEKIQSTNLFWNQLTISRLLYFLGFGLSFMLFIRKLWNVLKIRMQSNRKKVEEHNYFEIENTNEAFNFFNWIFMGSELTAKEKKLIYIHENEHRRLKHSYDLLALEILKISFWFNPLLIWLQNELKAVHEIQADKKIKTDVAKAYARLLLEKTMHCQPIALVNTFNKSILKTRIMLLKNTQQKRNGIIYLVLIPLLVLLISGSGFALNFNNFTNEKDNQSYLKQLYIWEKTGAKDQLEKFAQKVNEFENYQLSEDEFEMRKAWLKFQTNQSNTTKDLNIDLSLLKYEDYSLLTTSKDTISFAEVEEVPVFPGCEKLSSQDELKACMQQKITEHVSNEFDVEKVSAYSDEGINKIYVSFVVNSEGKVDEIRGRSNNSKLIEEAKRVVSKLPTMQPAKHMNKPVNIYYNLPIAFEIAKKEDE